MKAYYNPMTSAQKRALRDRLIMETNAVLTAKKKTMSDRIIAFMIMACRDEFKLGETRIKRLYERIKHEFEVQSDNMHDSGDWMLAADLHSIGLDELAATIMDDYEAEKETYKQTMFSFNEESNNV